MTRQVLATATPNSDHWTVTGVIRCILDAERADYGRACTMLRDRLRAAGHAPEVVILRGEVVVAYGPDDAETSSGALQDAPEDGEVPAGLARPAGTLVATVAFGAFRWRVKAGDRDLGTIAGHHGITDVIARAREVLAAAGVPAGDVEVRLPYLLHVYAPTETISSGTQGTPEDTPDAVDGQRPAVVDDPASDVDGEQGAGGMGTTRPHPAEDRGAGGSGEGSTRTPTSPFAAILAEVARLIEDGLPAPTCIRSGGADMQFSGDQCAEVDAWCARLGTVAADNGKPYDVDSGRPWVDYRGKVTLAGASVNLWCARYLKPCGPVPPVSAGSCAGTVMTRSRRALLHEVNAGDVLAEAGQAHHRVDGKRTARIVEALSAGWVAEGPQDPPGTQRRTYVLTDAGREAAAEYDRTRGAS